MGWTSAEGGRDEEEVIGLLGYRAVLSVDKENISAVRGERERRERVS